MNLASLTSKQQSVWDATKTHRMTIADGSVRSGKSVGADVAWIDFCRHASDGNLLMAGKTERTLKRNIVDPLIEILGSKRCRYVGGSGELWMPGPRGPRRVYLVGANDERAEEKIRGLTLIGAYVDELSTVPESFFTMLLSRLSLEGARLLATTNPDSPMHWLNVKYLQRAEELSLARFQFRLPDNPYLPTSFVENLRREITGLWARRMIDGEWCVAEGAVYEMWGEQHVVRPDYYFPPVSRLLAVGIDYGTTAPTAGLLIGISAEEHARLVVVDEWAPPSLTDAGLSVDYRKWITPRQPERVIVDPSAASFHKQLWADGVPGVVLADNAVIDGIRTVASLLAVGRLVVSSACTHLLTELPSYAWDPKATAKGQDAPVKQNDHWCDALRYGVVTTQSRWRHEVPLTMPIEIEEAA